MRLFFQILFSPLVVLRFLLLLLLFIGVTIIGYTFYLISGFSTTLQRNSMRAWGLATTIILGIRIKKIGKAEEKQFILMPNHRSYLDIIIMAYLNPASFIAKKEVRSWPLMKLAEKFGKIIFVDRSNLRSLVQTMHVIRKTVDENIPVALFPEGTTYEGPLTKPFKSGSFKIAVEANVPIIPVAISYKNKNDAWIGDDTFIGHFFRQMWKPITYVTVQYGEPIIENDALSLKEKTRQEIDAMLQEIN